MTMKWRKLGQVFEASGQYPWMQTHGAVPTAEILQDGNVAVYFATRDKENRGYTGRLIFSVERPTSILQLDFEPRPVAGRDWLL